MDGTHGTRFESNYTSSVLCMEQTRRKRNLFGQSLGKSVQEKSSYHSNLLPSLISKLDLHGFEFPSAAPQPSTVCLTAIFGEIDRKSLKHVQEV